MNKLLAIVFTVFLTTSLLAQKPDVDGPKFLDIEAFSKKTETAAWLVEYDRIAWVSTDELMKQDKKDIERLGSEWFCFQDKDKRWHAVYGKLTDGKYEVVFHFTVNADKIIRSDEKVDADFLNKHATALSTARAKLLTSIPAQSPKFNQYIRQNVDKTFSVWLLPAFQTNGFAVFGGEGVYTIDATGTKILKDESYFQKDFRGFKASPPRAVAVDYREIDQPTIGGVFFVWYYKPYFTSIHLDTRNITSTVIKTEAGYIWVNVERDTKPAEPSKVPTNKDN